MTDALAAIFCGLGLAAFIIGPCGAAETSGGNRKEPLTWDVWRKEAGVTLWALNPAIVWRDLLAGYSDVADAAVRLLGGIVVTAALLTSTGMIGWGFYRLFNL